jgi:hypothetical protein
VAKGREGWPLLEAVSCFGKEGDSLFAITQTVGEKKMDPLTRRIFEYFILRDSGLFTMKSAEKRVRSITETSSY